MVLMVFISLVCVLCLMKRKKRRLVADRKLVMLDNDEYLYETT